MIVLVRHGETDANARGLLLGRADPPLSEVGRGQASAVAALLGAEAPPAAVLTSPLRRCRETAECVAAPFGLPVEEAPAFVELDYGEWDERPLRDVPREAWTRWHDDVDFAPPGGESLRELQVRVDRAMGPLVERAGSASVVVVSHVSPIKAAVLWALGLSEHPQLTWRLRLDVASVTRITPGLVGTVLSGFNQRVAPSPPAPD